jgi:hypothetical protein
MIYLPKKFHVPSSTALLLITTKPQCKGSIRMTSIFLFHIYKDITVMKVHKYALIQDPKVRVATVALALEFRTSAMLYLLFVEN